MLPQPDHYRDHSSERRDPVPFSEAELEWRFRCRNSLEGAQRSAMKAALIAPLPFIVLVVVGSIMSAEPGGQFQFVSRVEFFVAGLLWTAILGGFYVLAMGIACGWLAHRFAFETAVPVTRIAIALAWVANLSLWGWMVVIVMAGS